MAKSSQPVSKAFTSWIDVGTKEPASFLFCRTAPSDPGQPCLFSHSFCLSWRGQQIERVPGSQQDGISSQPCAQRQIKLPSKTESTNLNMVASTHSPHDYMKQEPVARLVQSQSAEPWGHYTCSLIYPWLSRELIQCATVKTKHAFISLSHHCSGRVQSVGAPDLGEPSLWKPTAAVWAVCGQWVASSLLQHVRADVEPAGIWSRVSSFSVCVLSSFVWPRCSTSQDQSVTLTVYFWTFL